MYVFGGYTGSTGSYINTLIAYDPQANAWETISPSSGTAPSARAYHTGVWDWTNGRMWIFGGASNGVKYNDLHYYDVQANQWWKSLPVALHPRLAQSTLPGLIRPTAECGSLVAMTAAGEMIYTSTT